GVAKGGQRRIERRRPGGQFVNRVHVKKQIDEQEHAARPLDDVRRHAGGLHAFLNLPGKSIARLSHEIESVRVIDFGQTAVQLNWVWQRHTPARSWLRTSSRSRVAVSRGSIRRRKALLMAAGLRYSPVDPFMRLAA